MRILVISALYPPPIIGGAEVAARDFTKWLAAKGHEVAVLTTAASPDEEVVGEMVGPIRTWRLHWPRAYSVSDFQNQRAWKKPLWHLQDHFDPRNARLVGKVLDAFRPDFVNIHYLQGVGYNALGELARRDLPAMYVVNDLGLACVRMSMFKRGRQCERQCFQCRLSARWKYAQARKVRRFGLWSPSRANLDRLEQYFPAVRFPEAAIVYPNRYDPPTIGRVASPAVRFVYVGRLHPTKGVDLLIEALIPLAERFDFTLRVVGGGPSEADLRRRYGHLGWLSFTGQVAQAEVSNNLVASDALCIPSIWAEPLGIVVVHALVLGVPAIGSDAGGIPELIRSGENGLLVKPGDIDAWRAALERVLADPTLLAGWRAYAEAHAARFDQEALGGRVVDFMRAIEAMPATEAHAGRR